MTLKRTELLKAGVLAIGLSLVALTGSLAQAQTYPSRAVRMVVPFPPGTATDLAARMVGQQLSVALGQPFVVENKPGAGGSIAAMDVIRSAPDGHTVLFSSNSAISSNVALLKKIPYDPNTDFSPLAAIGDNMLVLMVKSNFPARNVQELVAYIKQRPGKVSAGYGSSSSQVSIAIFNKLAGVDALSVPYKGIPLAVNDVLGGTLDFTFVDIGNAMAQAKGGNMRALGVTSAKRNALVPDWPAISEVLPGFDITAWFAVVGPAGLPRDVVDKFNAAVKNALAQPELKDKLATIGLSPTPMTPEQLKAFISAEIVKWTRIVKDANIQPE
jgi:tripartite-type tricarboxylate transporter receptor subunit TctC